MRTRANVAPQLTPAALGVGAGYGRTVALAFAFTMVLVGCASVERPPEPGVQGTAAELKPPAGQQLRELRARAPSADAPRARTAAPEAGDAEMHSPAAADPESPAVSAPADQVGMASWYGGKFHRRRTASGELFDMRALTAAHPTLPFGSLVCVRSTVNRRTVVVRINDRGPHTGNRVIDLSRAAAEELGMIGLGLKPVELFALKNGERDCPEP